MILSGELTTYRVPNLIAVGHFVVELRNMAEGDNVFDVHLSVSALEYSVFHTSVEF